jgi:putative transposase
LELALGRYQGKRTGENSLFRTLHPFLQPDDVVLADRYFSGWFDIALLQQRAVEVVIRKHQLRATDFRTGQKLGWHDQLVCWHKPQRPAWMSREQYRTLPDTLTLREVRVLVAQPGFRTKRLVVVTTLVDAEHYPADEIAVLYRRRWQAELNLRSLKTVLQMDHLRCRTPHRVRNELAMHLVGYNLIRQLTATAACQAGKPPWTISFKGTLQTINHLLPILATTVSTDDWCDALLTAIATHLVGSRPDRIEPRVRKRRPKNYPLMNKPRQDYKRHAA